MPTFTEISKIPSIVSGLRKTFNSGKTLSEDFRRYQLSQLYKLIDENSDRLAKAIQSHLGRSINEIKCTDISVVLSETAHLMNNLNKYMQAQKVPSSAAFISDTGEMHYVPRGVVTIIGAWNFPIQLTIAPLAGAIAAGCCVILKPSDISDNVADILAELFPKYLDSECYQVVLAGPEGTTELLKQRFDLIFFTGNCGIGKIVMKAAAEHLTPVILELGGKNPVIVDGTIDMHTTCRRILFGRYLNAGQVCLSPEYVIIPRPLQKDFIKMMKQVIEEVFSENPQKVDGYARIINNNHFNRLSKILEENKDKIVYGGKCDQSDKYISPTILSDVDNNTPIMRDEVFGPILSVFPVDNIDECINIIQKKQKPLAMYIFSNRKDFIKKVLDHTDAGGVTVNDCIMHFAFPGLPFGGTGHSGMGSYHGWYSFLAFSHEKPVVQRSASLEFVNSVRLPPYTETKLKIWRALLEEKPKTWGQYINHVGAAAAVGGIAYWLQSKL